MEKDQVKRELAVILHADVVGSTSLVQKDEQLAHQRIQDAFRRFGDTIAKYHGRVRELRGDALLAEFQRASDAIIAAVAFQAENAESNTTVEDDIQPQLRVGISLGEVVIADGTVTGAGVVLAQRFRSQALHRGDIEAFEHGIYRDTITIFQFVVKAHGLAVDQYQIDFTMRYPERFNRVLDRRLITKPIGNGLFVMLASDEIIEFLVEAKIGQTGFQAYNSSQQ